MKRRNFLQALSGLCVLPWVKPAAEVTRVWVARNRMVPSSGGPLTSDDISAFCDMTIKSFQRHQWKLIAEDLAGYQELSLQLQLRKQINHATAHRR